MDTRRGGECRRRRDLELEQQSAVVQRPGGGLGAVTSEPATEQTNVGFGWALNLNTGSANSGQNRMRVYVK